jgi:hypothetical protein
VVEGLGTTQTIDIPRAPILYFQMQKKWAGDSLYRFNRSSVIHAQSTMTFEHQAIDTNHIQQQFCSLQLQT